jgi:hypothetical protein
LIGVHSWFRIFPDGELDACFVLALTRKPLQVADVRMTSNPILRPLFGLVVGLVVGGVGAVLFVQSMPPKEGSPEEQVAKLEVELKSTRNRLAA